jgi:hypothetical protein
MRKDLFSFLKNSSYCGAIAVLASLASPGCDRYPHSKLDISKFSQSAEYVSVKLWKLDDDLSCINGCTEDTNLSVYKLDSLPQLKNYRIGIHFGETSRIYRATVTTFSRGEGTNLGKYCIIDQSDPLLLGPFRTNEYFSEVSIALRPVFSGEQPVIPSTACIDPSMLQENSQKNPPLVSLASNISELRIIEASSARAMAPPASALSVNGWYFRPNSHIYIKYETKTEGSSSNIAEGKFSTDPMATDGEIIEMLNRSANNITAKLTAQQNGKLRGLNCSGNEPCNLLGGGIPGGARTTVTVTISGADGSTKFETTP